MGQKTRLCRRTQKQNGWSNTHKVNTMKMTNQISRDQKMPQSFLFFSCCFGRFKRGKLGHRARRRDIFKGKYGGESKCFDGKRKPTLKTINKTVRRGHGQRFMNNKTRDMDMEIKSQTVFHIGIFLHQVDYIILVCLTQGCCWFGSLMLMIG